jgi:Gas vesicle protein G
VGLITGLLTLPLAPVRGTVWLAERIQEQAEREYYDEGAIRAQLLDIEDAREAGEISEEEAAQAEDALVERLIAQRPMGGQESHGGVHEDQRE